MKRVRKSACALPPPPTSHRLPARLRIGQTRATAATGPTRGADGGGEGAQAWRSCWGVLKRATLMGCQPPVGAGSHTEPAAPALASQAQAEERRRLEEKLEEERRRRLPVKPAAGGQQGQHRAGEQPATGAQRGHPERPPRGATQRGRPEGPPGVAPSTRPPAALHHTPLALACLPSLPILSMCPPPPTTTTTHTHTSAPTKPPRGCGSCWWT